MDTALKGIVLGIGVLLGVLEPHLEPEFEGRLHRNAENLLLSFEVLNAVNDDVFELIDAGNRLVLETVVSGTLGTPLTYRHEISFDRRTGQFAVGYSETGRTHMTTSRAAAEILFVRHLALPLWEVESILDGTEDSVTVRIRLILPDDTRFDASVLWNYTKIERTWRFRSRTEIPY